MGRYHTPQAVTICPTCGREMEFGNRANVILQFEQSDRFNRKGVSRHVCRRCASDIAMALKLEAPIGGE